MEEINRFTLLLSDNDEFIENIGGSLAKCGIPEPNIAASSLKEVLDCDLETTPSLVIIDLAKTANPSIETIRRVSSHFNTSRVVCAGTPSESALVIELVKNGLAEFCAYPPDDHELKALLEEPTNVMEPRKLKPREATTVALTSPKGGSGVTLIAANLGVILAKSHPGQVIACSLSQQCGDIATYLDMVPKYTVRDLIDKHEQLDDSYIQGVIQKHSSGLHIISGPSYDQEPLTSRHLRSLQTITFLLKNRYQYVLIDTGGLEPGLLQMAWMQSNMFLLIGNLDIPSLKGLTAHYGRLIKLSYDSANIKLIINRYNAKNQLSLSEFEKNVGTPIACHIPNNYSLCIEAVNRGASLAELDPQAEMTQKISELAEMIESPQHYSHEPTTNKPSKNSIKQKLTQIITGRKD